MGASTAAQREIEDVIQTRKGQVIGSFRSIAEGRILISHVDNDACPRGALCMTNRDQHRRSPKRITHSVYVGGVYDLHRALTHIVKRSGLSRSPLFSGDVRLIEQMIQDAQSRSRSLFQLEFLTDEESQMMDKEFQKLLQQLKHGRNVHKVQAFFHFGNSRNLRDRLGRRNVSAAALRVGTGIGNLMERRREIVQVISRIDARIPHVVALIEACMQPFYKLRELSTPLSVTDPRRTVRPYERFEARLQQRREKDVEFLEEKLRECAIDFESIDVVPFSEHAQLLRKELLFAARACCDGELSEVRQHLKVIRQLLTVVFAKHALEISLIAPLSYALNEMSHRESLRRKHLRAAPTEEEDRHFFNPVFERIEHTLGGFYANLKKCSDDSLSVRYLDEVRTIVGHALAEAKGGRWDHCKNLLKKASTHLT